MVHHKQEQRRDRRQKPDDDESAAYKFDNGHPPLVKTQERDVILGQLLDVTLMPRFVEQLVVTGQHEERTDRDAVERERDVGPPDTMKQKMIDHRHDPFDVMRTSKRKVLPKLLTPILDHNRCGLISSRPPAVFFVRSC